MRAPLRADCREVRRGGRLALPESVFHVGLDHDRKGALVALAGWGIGNHRAGLLGHPYRLLDVFDR